MSRQHKRDLRPRINPNTLCMGEIRKGYQYWREPRHDTWWRVGGTKGKKKWCRILAAKTIEEHKKLWGVTPIHVRLKAYLHNYDGKKPTAAMKAQLKKELKSCNLKTRAWCIIKSAAGWLEGGLSRPRYLRGTQVQFDVYDTASGSFGDGPLESVLHIFGDGNADSWMEGNICWDKDFELFLDLVSAKFVPSKAKKNPKQK